MWESEMGGGHCPPYLLAKQPKSSNFVAHLDRDDSTQPTDCGTWVRAFRGLRRDLWGCRCRGQGWRLNLKGKELVVGK